MARQHNKNKKQFNSLFEAAMMMSRRSIRFIFNNFQHLHLDPAAAQQDHQQNNDVTNKKLSQLCELVEIYNEQQRVGSIILYETRNLTAESIAHSQYDLQVYLPDLINQKNNYSLAMSLNRFVHLLGAGTKSFSQTLLFRWGALTHEVNNWNEWFVWFKSLRQECDFHPKLVAMFMSIGQELQAMVKPTQKPQSIGFQLDATLMGLSVVFDCESQDECFEVLRRMRSYHPTGIVVRMLAHNQVEFVILQSLTTVGEVHDGFVLLYFRDARQKNQDFNKYPEVG